MAQREQYIAVITGVRLAETLPIGTSETPGPGEGVSAVPYVPAEAGPAQVRPGKVRREREPVHWTTVLLFLGAFLVIIASGIFAAVVWDITGPGFKLAFLGALTVAFYVGGYLARTKYQLRAGGVALTVVASAMLLFDCWIVIDGFNLTGPYPWALAMLLCSAVYWLTEVWTGDRFYGVVGAAAQIGWWWLLRRRTRCRGAGANRRYRRRRSVVAADRGAGLGGLSRRDAGAGPRVGRTGR